MKIKSCKIIDAEEIMNIMLSEGAKRPHIGCIEEVKREDHTKNLGNHSTYSRYCYSKGRQQSEMEKYNLLQDGTI